MCTHNLCFGSQVRKIVIPCKPQFHYIQVGYKGVYISWTCFLDVSFNKFEERIASLGIDTIYVRI